MGTAKPKIVFLDWNGTISGSKFWGHLEVDSHPRHDLFTKIQDILFGEQRKNLEPWMRGQTNAEDIVRQLSQRINLPYELIFDELIKSCRTMEFSTTRLVELVKQIQNMGIKVVIATDNMDTFVRWTIPALGLRDIFDDILDSYTLKVLKRDFDQTGKNLFFSDYLNKNHIQFSECVLVDDSEDKNNLISNTGIIYRRIKPVIGLEPELINILRIFN